MRNILKKFLFLQIFLIYASNAHSIKEFNFNNPLFNAIEQNDNSEILTLIKSGIPINAKEIFDITPLMRATFKSNKEIVRLLLDLGANVNNVDIGGATALHIATRTGNSNIVKTLLAQENILIDPQDKDGWTPLMRSVIDRNIENTILLLDRGADPFKKNKFGQSSITHAILNNNILVMKLFADRNLLSSLDHKTFDELLKLAHKKNNSQIISLLELRPVEHKELNIEVKQSDLLASIAKEDLIILNNGELATIQERLLSKDNDLFKEKSKIIQNILSNEVAKQAEVKSVDIKPLNNENITSASSNSIDNEVLLEENIVSVVPQKEVKIKPIDLKPLKNETTLTHFNHDQEDNESSGLQLKNSLYWIEISSNNFTDARKLFDDHSEEISKQYLEIRLAKSVQDKKKYAVQAGPISTQQQFNIVCNILSNKQRDCKLIKLINMNNQNRYQ